MLVVWNLHARYTEVSEFQCLSVMHDDLLIFETMLTLNNVLNSFKISGLTN